VVLPIRKVAVYVKFSDYRPISLLACLSKVFEVLMARQMEAHIRRNEFQSGFRMDK
jgi:small basic protein